MIYVHIPRDYDLGWTLLLGRVCIEVLPSNIRVEISMVVVYCDDLALLRLFLTNDNIPKKLEFYSSLSAPQRAEQPVPRGPLRQGRRVRAGPHHSPPSWACQFLPSGGVARHYDWPSMVRAIGGAVRAHFLQGRASW